MGCLEPDRLGVQGESHQLAFLHYQPNVAFCLSSPACHTSPKCPAWDLQPKHLWLETHYMRCLGKDRHHEEKCQAAGAACFGSVDMNFPWVRQHPSSCAHHLGQGGGLTRFTWGAKGTSSFKIHSEQASGCSLHLVLFNSHSLAKLSSP